MADLKISQLPVFTSAVPAVDAFAVVSGGTTKQITTNQILGSGGVATLASATITGALTVDTTTLVVDSTLNRVGIGTATPTAALDILGAFGTATAAAVIRNSSASSASNIAQVQFFTVNSFGGNEQVASIHGSNPNALGNNGGSLVFNTSLNGTGTTPAERYRIGNDGTATWSVAGTTAMTLNATGLGVGIVPSSWGSNSKVLQFGGGEAAISSTGAGSTASRFTHGCYFDNTNWKYQSPSVGASLYEVTGANAGSTHAWYVSAGGTAGNTITDFATAKMTLDASGNLLVGTATSLQNTSHSFKALGTSNSFWASTFQHDGTVGSPRLLGWRLPNSSDSNAYFVYAINSGGNCFNVFGNGSVNNSTGTYGTISDLRLKENISDARNYLADLLKLRVVKYSLKSEQSAVATKIGFVAQEVEQVFPTLVETNGDDVKSIKTSILIPMLLKAIQELTARVQTLEAK